jgi:hypothetical protein
MSVEFNEESGFNKMYDKSGQTGGLTNWVINKGIAKDEKGAKIILNTITVVCFSLAIFFAIK